MSSRRPSRLILVLTSLGLALLAGCAAPRRAGEGSPAVVIGSGEAPPEGQRWLWIDSVPAGATVVIDGRPVGRAPVRVTVPATAKGFFAATTTIRVRFLATAEGTPATSQGEEFTLRDRIPARVEFSASGVRRVH